MKRATRCAACGAPARRGSRHRAFVLSLGRVRPGMVCTKCAKLGWLLVFGGDTAEQPRTRKRRAPEPTDPRQEALAFAREHAGIYGHPLPKGTAQPLPSPHGSREVVSVDTAKRQLNPKGRKRSRSRKP